MAKLEHFVVNGIDQWARPAEPRAVNLIRIDVEFRCSQEQAEGLIGEVDHVEYGSDTGIAKAHTTTTSNGHLLADMEKALDRVHGLLGAAGLGHDSVTDLSLSSEALIEDDEVWRRRDESNRMKQHSPVWDKAEVKANLDKLMRGLKAYPSVALVFLPECEPGTFHKLTRYYDGDLLEEAAVSGAFRNGVDQVFVHGLREYAC